MSFSVSPQREIIMNLPTSGYLITVFSREGEVLQEIGKIDKEIKWLNKKKLALAKRVSKNMKYRNQLIEKL
jgi:hypothetical protein